MQDSKKTNVSSRFTERAETNGVQETRISFFDSVCTKTRTGTGLVADGGGGMLLASPLRQLTP